MELKEILQQIENVQQNGHIYIRDINHMVKCIKRNHDLAVKLWQTKQISTQYGARELAVRIAEKDKITTEQLDNWVIDLKNWELTDSFTGQLVKHTKFATEKVYDWVNREPEFEKRAGFALIAQMAWSKNNFSDKLFIDFLPLIEKASIDDRFYVKKAVNWALRDIGKRNENLQKYAQKLSLKLQKSDNKTAVWIGRHRSKEIFPVKG